MPYRSVQNRADVKPAFETKQVSGGKKGGNYRGSKDGEAYSRMEAVLIFILFVYISQINQFWVIDKNDKMKTDIILIQKKIKY